MHVRPLSFVILLAIVGLLFSSATTPLPAAGTGRITYQARVTSSSGSVPLADGSYTMRFGIWNNAQDGNPGANRLWVETQNSVPVEDGFFTVALGSVTPFPSDDMFTNTQLLWLEIEIDFDGGGFNAPDVITPRRPLEAVPYSFHADHAFHALVADEATSATFSNQTEHAATADLATLATDALTADFADEADNADTVDGFHAAGSPNRNVLLPLNSDSQWPLATIPQGDSSGLDADTLDGLEGSDYMTKNVYDLDDDGVIDEAAIPAVDAQTVRASQVGRGETIELRDAVSLVGGRAIDGMYGRVEISDAIEVRPAGANDLVVAAIDQQTFIAAWEEPGELWFGLGTLDGRDLVMHQSTLAFTTANAQPRLYVLSPTRVVLQWHASSSVILSPILIADSGVNSTATLGTGFVSYASTSTGYGAVTPLNESMLGGARYSFGDTSSDVALLVSWTDDGPNDADLSLSTLVEYSTDAAKTVVVPINEFQYVILWEEDTTDFNFGTVVTVGGGGVGLEPDLGETTQFDDDFMTNVVGDSINPQQAVMAYNRSGGVGDARSFARVMTVGGIGAAATLDFSPRVEFDQSSFNRADLLALNEQQFMMVAYDSLDSQDYNFYWFGSVTGFGTEASIEVTERQLLLDFEATPTLESLTKFDGSSVLFVYGDEGNNSGRKARHFMFPVPLGVAQEAGVGGDTIDVLMRGLSTGHDNLLAGRVHYGFPDGSITTVPGTAAIGTALSESELLVNDAASDPLSNVLFVDGGGDSPPVPQGDLRLNGVVTVAGAKLEGPVEFLQSGYYEDTFLHYRTNARGNPNGDGLRVAWNHKYNGTFSSTDALIIEKTDSTNTPDGLIGFYNTGADGVREPSVVMLGGGLVGVGNDRPLANLHVEGQELPLPLSAVNGEELIVEGTDAVIGIYSEDAGTYGSAIALGDIRAGAFIDKWSISRDSSSSGSEIRLNYGPNANYGSNTTLAFMATDGRLALNRTSVSHPIHVGTSSANGNGAHLTATGTWTSVSDADKKEGFVPVDVREVLARVIAMPVTAWKYRGDATSSRHIGPTAQDFFAAFGLGHSDRHIGMIDADGVALAAIQGLHAETQDELERLHAENAELRARLERLERLLTNGAVVTPDE